ncbi:hypothetical protein QBC35DRAFT_457609 [Podospora australis]|uniref:Uncharacterized protein n=1 Tax=Podospora australis TaxID=1536484 RepID=A0AAN6WHD5_9PEZI|nr:hypothetical protein QBC35DRAFT_457609 [Podospora australis]
MSQQPPQKRARADTTGQAHLPAPPSSSSTKATISSSLPKEAQPLFSQELDRYLGLAAVPPAAANTAVPPHQELQPPQALTAKPAALPLPERNFDHHIQLIITKYERNSDVSSKWFYEATSEVEDVVENAINTIARKVKPQSSYKTKVNALANLRDIFEYVAEGGDGSGVGSAVRNNAFKDPWGEKLIEVVGNLSDEERKRLVNDEEGGKWMDRWDECVRVTESYGIRDELQTGEAAALMRA